MSKDVYSLAPQKPPGNVPPTTVSNPCDRVSSLMIIKCLTKLKYPDTVILI